MNRTNLVPRIKRGLVQQLSQSLRGFGSSQQVIAERLGIPRPDVSAILAGDTSRFTIDRLILMLQRLGRDANLELVPDGEGGRVTTQSDLDALGLPHLRDLVKTGPGLVLIGGDPRNGQTELLTAILAEHRAQADPVILYSQKALTGIEIPTARFTNDDDLERFVLYADDIDLPQRERLGRNAVGVDYIGKLAALPWTVLHFAKSSRTYAIIHSPSGKDEGQRAVDELVHQLGPPHGPFNRKHVFAALQEIVVMHARPAAQSTGTVYFASRFTVNPAVEKLHTVIDPTAVEQRLVDAGDIMPRRAPQVMMPLSTADQARQFITHVRETLGSDFEITGPNASAKREIELEVQHPDSEATVEIAASWSPSERQFGIVITTDEPDDLLKQGITPETRLSLAPTDVDYIVTKTRSFMSRFNKPAP